MEITAIKQQLPLSKVLTHYGLTPDTNRRLRCPFHTDRTPSLQVYPDTNTCYCFSSNCKTHGKAMDVIDFIMYKENTSKHEAILKAQQIMGQIPTPTTLPTPKAPSIHQKQPSQVRTEFLERMFAYFCNGILNSNPAKTYLCERGLHVKTTEVGYNGGQFHHGERRGEDLINSALQYGLLLDQDRKSRTGNPAYTPFGKNCICFALRDKAGNIVSLYFRSIIGNQNSKHYYLRDRQGLYPGYPKPDITKLILCESIIDAATLLEQERVRANYSVLALYGTNGFTDEHKLAISELTKLSEIVLFMDGDEAGETAITKYTNLFEELYPQVKISRVDTPLGEDINSLLVGHHGEILSHLIDTRITAPIEVPGKALLFSTETKIAKEQPIELSDEKRRKEVVPEEQAELDTSHPYNLKYRSGDVLYQIKGFRCEQLDSLKVTLQILIR